MEKKVNILIFNLGNKYIATPSVHDEMNELTGFMGDTLESATDKAIEWSMKNGYDNINIDFCESQKQFAEFVFKHSGGWSKRF